MVRLNPTTMSLRDGQTRSPAVASTGSGARTTSSSAGAMSARVPMPDPSAYPPSINCRLGRPPQLTCLGGPPVPPSSGENAGHGGYPPPRA